MITIPVKVEPPTCEQIEAWLVRQGWVCDARGQRWAYYRSPSGELAQVPVVPAALDTPLRIVPVLVGLADACGLSTLDMIAAMKEVR